jgi:MYXO-CTERM domain-containing protein
VLVAGGADGNAVGVRSAECYDPMTRVWSTVAPMSAGRYRHTATLLPNGNVLVAGGTDGVGHLTGVELYDPVSATWVEAGALTGPVAYHAATLLADGRALFTGGSNTPTTVSDAVQSYDEGRGAKPAWTPWLEGLFVTASTRGDLQATGKLFTGISEGSGGGTQSSTADHPVLTLRRLDNEAMAFAAATAWTSATASFTLPSWLPQGQYLAWVATAGVLSNGRFLVPDMCNTPIRCGSDCRPCSLTGTRSVRCAGGAEPAASACTVACLPGFANLDKDRSNGCEPVSQPPDAAIQSPDGAASNHDAEPPVLDASSDRPSFADVATTRLARRGGCSCSLHSDRPGSGFGFALLALLALLHRRLWR